MCSWTDQRGGNITKSAIAVPSFADGQVKTVNIEGSYNSKNYKICIFYLQPCNLKTYNMIKGNRINNTKQTQVIFIWCIISMPSDYIKTTMILGAHKKTALKLVYNLEPCNKNMIKYLNNYVLQFIHYHLPVGTSLSSKCAVGTKKSRGLAKPLAPIGPKSGSLK